MKRFFLLIICAMCALSCGSSRKYVETSTDRADSTELKESIVEKSVVSVDTTMTAQGTVTVTEVEFFPPDAEDSLKNGGECSIDISSDAAAVKSSGQRVKRIRQTVINNTIEKKGLAERSESSALVTAESSVSVSSEAVREEETPVPVPNPWRRVCLVGFAVVVVLAVLYLKRIPILGWIRKILSCLKKII